MGDIALTPTQDLFIEVLAARHRLGESVWTFGLRHARTANQLAVLGLVAWKDGVTEGAFLAWLTPGGRAFAMSPDYTPPVLRDAPDQAPATARGRTGTGAARTHV